jgi:hypothetical protein
MRHVLDTLVWFGLILMVAAVVYFTPRVADYVSSLGADEEIAYRASRELVLNHQTELSHADR